MKQHSIDLRKGKFEDELSKHPHLEPFYTVKPKYFEATFEVIDTEYGGVEVVWVRGDFFLY